MSPTRQRRVPLDLGGLTGAGEPFRLAGSRRCDPEVEAWLGGRPPELRPLVQEWVGYLRRCGEDVYELLHDGGAVACVQDAAFACVQSFRLHVNVGFFHGAQLADPGGLLQGSGKRMRHVKLRPGHAADAPGLRALIDAAYADIRARVR